MNLSNEVRKTVGGEFMDRVDTAGTFTLPLGFCQCFGGHGDGCDV